MAHIYVVDSSTSLGLRQGQLIIRNPTLKHERSISLANVDGISIFGMAQLSTQLIRTCLSENISVGYYTDDGHYIGKTSSFSALNPDIQKRQVYLTDNTCFCLGWSRVVISAKIKNSLRLLESACNCCEEANRITCPLWRALRNLGNAASVEECIGYEGDAAKRYFFCINKLIERATFYFSGRSSHPPRDAFNSMISYGYSLLYRNIIGAIERHGLHPYFSFMHRPRYGHAALASDLIEDCRAAIVDGTVLNAINSGLVPDDGFDTNEQGAVYMNRETAHKVTDLFSESLVRKRAYFAAAGDNRRYGFQTMLDMKLNSVVSAIENEDLAHYKPFVWR